MLTKLLNRLEAATGAVIEALEHRRLLSVTLDHGVLTVRGTADNDVLTIISNDSPDFYVYDNGRLRLFHRADVTGLLILGGDGHDELGVTEPGSYTDIPLTIRGGAGDDTLFGSRAYDILNGGSGEDEIAGVGWLPNMHQWSLAPVHTVGNDLIYRTLASPDQVDPESTRGEDDDFHGDAADLPSMRVHNGVLYLTGTSGDDVIDVTTWSRGRSGWSTRGQVSTATAMPWQYGWFARQIDWPPVTRVVIDGRGGDDHLQFSHGGPMSAPAFELTAGGVTRGITVTPGVFRIGPDGSFAELADSGSVTLVDGLLTVRGTSGVDQLMVGSWWDDDLLVVYVNRTYQTFERAQVREIYVDCGDGNDDFMFYNFSTFVTVPVTVSGGAGDDWLDAQDGRDHIDHLMPGPFTGMHATLLGGDGDDVIRGGVSDDYADGGAGNNTLFGFPERPTPPAPVEPEPVSDGDSAPTSDDTSAETGTAAAAVTPSATQPPSAFAGAFATVGSSTEPGVWSDAAADPMGMTREEDGVL